MNRSAGQSRTGEMKRVLVLGAAGRNGVAVGGALAGRGYYMIGMDEQPNNRVIRAIKAMGSPSIFDDFVFVRSFSGHEADAFVHTLKKLIVEHEVDVLVPTGTRFTLWVAEKREALSELCAVPAEDPEKMAMLHDKWSAVQLCECLDIPTPKTVLVEDRDGLESVKDDFQYPVVLKARLGASNDGVWVAEDADSLVAVYRKEIEESGVRGHIASDRSSPMIQEFIPGELHDVTSFSVEGTPRAVLSQVRRMTSPLWGGSGIANETTDNEELREYARRIIRHTGWDGILEFDFKIDSRDAKPKLIEINPKIWGTTWLTVSAGFNMPLYLVQKTLGEPVEIPDSYRVGLSARWPFLEIATWFEEPRSLRVVTMRVVRFVRMFGQKDMVYDLSLLGPRAVVGEVVIMGLGWIKALLRVLRG